MTVLDGTVLLAVLAVVPGAVGLLPGAGRWLAAAVWAAGLPVLPAMAMGRGPAAGLLVVPWLAAAAVTVVVAFRVWWSRGRRWPAVVWPLAAGYLAVGAGWMLADRLGLQPAGIGRPLVVLTAIHFHYAGLVALVIAGRARRAAPSPAATIAVALVAAGPPLVAAGFVTHGVLQVAGAVVLAVGLWLTAWVTAVHVIPQVDRRPARWLLAVSAVSVLVPMALAVHWAAGSLLGLPVLSIPVMARTHGAVNAVGFALAGVAGWQLSGPD